jgi:hypothetical protein
MFVARFEAAILTGYGRGRANGEGIETPPTAAATVCVAPPSDEEVLALGVGIAPNLKRL